MVYNFRASHFERPSIRGLWREFTQFSRSRDVAFPAESIWKGSLLLLAAVAKWSWSRIRGRRCRVASSSSSVTPCRGADAYYVVRGLKISHWNGNYVVEVVQVANSWPAFSQVMCDVANNPPREERLI
ncbi:hypothetical protein TNCV_2110451 [Trichonephila clavipes]|nr:hypothetical protein TNCV_2110451 [Trichonephila clavipes]